MTTAFDPRACSQDEFVSFINAHNWYKRYRWHIADQFAFLVEGRSGHGVGEAGFLVRVDHTRECMVAIDRFQDRLVEEVLLPAPTQEVAMQDEIKTVKVPALAEHGGYPWNAVEVRLVWRCPVCGGPRGAIHDTLSYDGSRRLYVSGWTNPCGHVDKYNAVRDEASTNGLN